MRRARVHNVHFILVFLVLAAAECGAQGMPRMENTSVRLGAFGTYDPTFQNAGFSSLPGTASCCPHYTNGDGTGFSAGAMMHIPLSSTFFLQLRAGYGTDHALLASDERSVFNVDGEAVPAVIRHEIDARSGFVSIEPRLGVFLWQGLHLLGGVWAAYVVSDAYTQRETLIEPATGTFNNGQRTRNPASGGIPDVSRIAVAVGGGLGWTIPMATGNGVVLAPEITWRRQLTPIVSRLDWQRQTLNLGVSLSVAIGGPSPIIRAPGPIDVKPEYTPTPTVKTPPPELPIVTVDVDGGGADGVAAPVRDLHVEEFVIFEMQPLLHYVFFEQGSADIPDRYVKLEPAEAASFTENALQGGRVLDTYHSVLNIVGSRMSRNPAARITLVGCNSGVGDEASNLALSRERAERVAGYLARTWGIAPARMTIEARNLPEKPTTNQEGDGYAENRRVEILSRDDDILRPMLLSDTTQLPDPRTITFIPRVRYSAPIASWSLKITDGAAPLREFTGDGPVPEAIPWTVSENWSDTFRNASRLTYALSVQAADGVRASTEGALRTDVVTIEKKRAHRVADIEIDLYNLILFDFGSTILSDANKRLAEFIRGRIKPGAVVSVSGYTDKIGDARFNQRLSRDRAQATADELGIPNTRVFGIGEVEVQPNRLPEGRFYNRTVSVKVETPVRP